MQDDFQQKTARKPFGKRLQGSAIILLIIAFLLGLGWSFIALFSVLLTPIDSYEENLRSLNLPPRETLSTADGRVADMGFYVSGRRQYLKPKVEFVVEGKMYRAETINGYAPELYPFKQFQTAQVFYLPNQPEKSWQRWEYENLIGEYENAKAVPLIVRVKTIYNYLAFGLIVLTVLLLTVNLFVPLRSLFKSVKV